MNIEDRLSEAMHATFDPSRPSPELEASIVERISVSGSRPGRVRPRPVLGGLAAIALVIGLAVTIGPLASRNRSGGAPANGTLSPSASASAVPAGSLAHFDRDGLAFSYPASWQASVSGVNMHYVTILDFLGTGSGRASCHSVTPGPGDKFISGTECGTDFKIDPGQVVVELSRQDGPPMPGPIDPANPSGIEPGERYVAVGGLPAIFGDGSGGQTGTVTMTWTLSVPGELISRYQIYAQIKGPGTEQMRAQVLALVSSLSYDPLAPVLRPSDGPRIAAIGLAQARAGDASLACFPSVPGTTVTATISQFPGYSPMRKPLPVTCTTQIEPVSIGLWRMTLTESWTAASDRKAGSLTTTIWLASDGTPGTTEGGPAPSELPYWP